MRPGYKQTDAGIVPEDWDVDPLGNHVQITSGESPSGLQLGSNGRPYFKVEQLGSSEKYLDRNSTPYHFVIGPTVPSQSVVFAKRGAAIALNKVRILSEDSFMDTNLMALTPSQGLESEYLHYALAHIGLWKLADTTSVPQINNKHIKPLLFPLPRVKEQRAIAAALSDVDSLLSGLDRLIAKKRDLKQATMQQLLTGQVRLPDFHGEWEVSTVGREFEVQLGKMLDAEKNVGVPKPFIGNKAVQWDGIDVSELTTVPMSRSDIERFRLSKGDLLVCEGGEVGRAAIWEAPIEECYYQKALHRLRPIRGFNSRLMAAILRLWSDGSTLLNYVTQTSIAHLPREKFMEVPIPVPSPTEQSAIAAVLFDVDAELAALGARREKTRALKQGMMQELLTGRTRLVPRGHTALAEVTT